MRLYAEFEKVTDNADGTITVSGIASSEAVDSDGEQILASAIRAALPDYLRFPAVREMHDAKKAAGTALSIDVGDDGRTRIEALLVDPVTIAKVKTRTLRGFSIGGQVRRRSAANAKVIEELTLSEVSVVDRPSNGDAVISLWKADGKKPDGKGGETVPSSVPKHPRSGDGTDNRHDSAVKPVDPKTPRGPTLNSRAALVCKSCGGELAVTCGTCDEPTAKAASAALEIAEVLHKVAAIAADALEKSRVEAEGALQKLGAVTAALAKVSGERDALKMELFRRPKGSLKAVPISKAADVDSTPEADHEPDEPLGTLDEIKRVHAGGGRVVAKGR